MLLIFASHKSAFVSSAWLQTLPGKLSFAVERVLSQLLLPGSRFPIPGGPGGPRRHPDIARQMHNGHSREKMGKSGEKTGKIGRVEWRAKKRFFTRARRKVSAFSDQSGKTGGKCSRFDSEASKCSCFFFIVCVIAFFVFGFARVICCSFGVVSWRD